MQSAVKPVYTKQNDIGGSGAGDDSVTAWLTRGKDVYIDEGNDGLVPYFVSGPLHREFSIVGVLGALTHVGAWVAAFGFDIAIMNDIDMDLQKDSADYFYFSYWPFVVAFAIVVLSTLLHAGDYMCSGRDEKTGVRNRKGPLGRFKVPEGDFPPFLMSIITGANILSIFFMFILMSSSAGQGLDAAASEKWRRDVCFCILCKFYIYSFIENNKQWAGPAPEVAAAKLQADRKAAARKAQGNQVGPV